MKKYAIFTMDIEAFSDTECLKNKSFDHSNEMFDGIENYLALLDKYNIKANLFVVANTINKIKDILTKAILNGHKVGIHGYEHIAPLLLKTNDFKEDIKKAKNLIENELNIKVYGHRAPCFSINEERLDILKELGLKYDSSYLDYPFTYHNGHLNLDSFIKICDQIYKKNEFYEFSIPVCEKFPIGGGGYVRIAPWPFIRHHLKKYLKNETIYIFYLHPFEVSNAHVPKISKLKGYDRVYLEYNKNKNYLKRIEKIIKLLIKEEFQFTTFEDIIEIEKKSSN